MQQSSHIRFIFLLSLLSVLPTANAHDNWRIGLGSLPCREYVKVATSASEESRLLVVSWMQGYLMGMNTVQSVLAPERDIKEIPDSDSLQAQMLLYCKSKPANTVIDETTELFSALPALKK
jgi:hypothetical protein